MVGAIGFPALPAGSFWVAKGADELDKENSPEGVLRTRFFIGDYPANGRGRIVIH